MGRGSVCDPFDAAAIVERIATGETTAAEAWGAYASTAERPCARATFAQGLSRARTVRARRPAPPLKPRTSLRLDQGSVLVIGPNAALRVRGGALDVEHGFKPDRVRVRIDIDEPKPAAILFDAHGEFLTGEAIRWCA